jgi:hypothetical protein
MEEINGIYDSEMKYLFVLVASRGRDRSSVILQYDGNKRLIQYTEGRNWSHTTGDPIPSPTQVSISTGYGKEHWMRYAKAENRYYLGKSVVGASFVQERAEAAPEEIWSATQLGPPSRILQLTLDKCRADGGFERFLPPPPLR